MGNKNDGIDSYAIANRLIKKGNHYEPLFITTEEAEIMKNIKSVVEKGAFSQNEQSQYSKLMKTVDKYGGMDYLNDGALKELEHIVKTLSSSGDKSTMMNDEINNFMKTLPQNTKSR